MECEGKTSWCTNKEVKICQMVNYTVNGVKHFEGGAIVYLCRECRKFKKGNFRYVKY